MHTARVYASGAQTNLVSGYTTYMRRSPEVDGSLPPVETRTHLPYNKPATPFAVRPYCRRVFTSAAHSNYLRYIALGSQLTSHFFLRELIPAGDVYNKCNDDSNILSECLHVTCGDAYSGVLGKFVCVLAPWRDTTFGYRLVYTSVHYLCDCVCVIVYVCV